MRITLIEEIIRSAAKDDVVQILQQAESSELIRELQNGLERIAKGNNSAIKNLMAYGIKHLPCNNERPNELMADFFYVLSELKHISNVERSRMVECMVYCETDEFEYKATFLERDHPNRKTLESRPRNNKGFYGVA